MRGCPCWTRPAPANTLQETAEPISQAGGTLGEMYLTEGKVLHSTVRSEGKCEKTALQTLRSVKEVEVLQAPEQRFPSNPCSRPCWCRYPRCRLWRTPSWSRWRCPQGTMTHGGPTLEQVYPKELQPVEDACWSRAKCEKEGAVRNCYRPTKLPTPHPLCASGSREEGKGTGKEGVELSLRLQGEWEDVDLGFVFVSHHPTTFYLAIN